MLKYPFECIGKEGKMGTAEEGREERKIDRKHKVYFINVFKHKPEFRRPKHKI